jgi:hypothetical protein
LRANRTQWFADAPIVGSYCLSRPSTESPHPVAMFEAQGRACYVCGAPRRDTRLCIDHDHSIVNMRESVRGLLCDECNYSRLPRFQENATMLQRGIDHLTDPPARRVLSSPAAAPRTPPVPEGLLIADGCSEDDEGTTGQLPPADRAPEVASRPGTPPVGSQRRPGPHSTSTRSTGRNSGSRRRQQAGEADG